MQKYQPLQQIGKGSFGIVRKVLRQTDQQLLVWKQINYDRMSSRQKQQLVTEVNLLKGLDHPNIVKYEDRIVDKKAGKVYIIMEYCSGGDLGSYLRMCKKQMQYVPEDIIWKIAYQLLTALEYCHSRTTDEKGRGGKVFHRDIKPANIFINEHNYIKLGDFGLSRQMGEHSQFAKTHVGTPYYMSPQQVLNFDYNEKSDIWSAGCLIFEMASLKRPFQASNSLALAKKIEDGRYERIPYRYSENLYDLIKKMLVVDPNKRKGAKQLLSTNPVFLMRAKQDKLKQRISLIRERELHLRQKEKQLEKQFQRYSYEEDSSTLLTLKKKKSSRQSRQQQRFRYTYDKQNRDTSNYQKG